MKFIALFLIKAYQKVNFLLPPSQCRFMPTCSNYSYQAIEKYGILKGIKLSIIRISHCHPWHKGGLDPLK